METIASVLDSWSALPLKWRGPDAPKLNALLLKVKGGELRIVGEFLPHVPAHIEHRTYCENCEGAGFVRMTRPRRPGSQWVTEPCERCDGEGYEPLTDDEPCNDEQTWCRDCERMQHVVTPGWDIEVKHLGVRP